MALLGIIAVTERLAEFSVWALLVWGGLGLKGEGRRIELSAQGFRLHARPSGFGPLRGRRPWAKIPLPDNPGIQNLKLELRSLIAANIRTI